LPRNNYGATLLLLLLMITEIQRIDLQKKRTATVEHKKDVLCRNRGKALRSRPPSPDPARPTCPSLGEAGEAWGSVGAELLRLFLETEVPDLRVQISRKHASITPYTMYRSFQKCAHPCIC